MTIIVGQDHRASYRCHGPAWAARLMTEIVKAELLMVALTPKVARTDAIQSFVSNALMLEYILQLDEITKSWLDIRDGVAHAPMAPGLGIDWDWNAVKSRAVDGLSTEIGG